MTMFQTLRRRMGGSETLKITCEACGHEVTWTQAHAFRVLGPDATPFEIRRRLACSACGRTGRVHVWI
jgi:hypothetical protein